MTERGDDVHSAADPFASVFQVLRSSLTAQVGHGQPNRVNGSDATTPHPAAAPALLNAWPHGNSSCKAYHRSVPSSSPADAFLGILSQRDPNVRAALLQQIQPDNNTSSYAAARIHELQRERKLLRRRTQTRIQELQQQQQAIAHDCDHVVHQATVDATRYAHFARQSDERANERLQTLLFECIAEGKKALDRIDGVAMESTDESESMTHERTKQFEWDVFLARLQQDLNGSIRFSQLYPLWVLSNDTNNSSSNTVRPKANASSSDSDIKAMMRGLLVRNGPVLETEQTLHVQRVIAILPSMSNGSFQSSATSALVVDNTDGKGKPSLHFGDSGSSTWTEIVRSTLQSASPAPPTSRRSHRRLLPSKSASTAAMTFSTNTDGEASEIRQLATKTTLQFPRTACDVPLSSTCISWLLRSNCRSTEPGGDGGEYGWLQTIDSNVYFDLEEYERNLTKTMNQEQSATSSDTHFVTDKAVFASARRSLHEVNVILEHAKKIGSHPSHRSSSFAPSQMHQLLFARRSQQSVDSSSSEGQRRPESVFVRASVLQLLQTAYYCDQFLPKLSPSDVVFLEQLYPTSHFGASIFSNLYVPYFDVDVDANPAAEPEVVVPASSNRAIVMKPLDEKAIHELLLVYVARGRQQDHSSGTTNQLTSLARSDSISTLLPSHLGVCEDEDEDKEERLTKSTKRLSVVHHCTIKNPGSLWKQGRAVKRNGSVVPLESTELQAISSADYLYVEYHLVQSTPQELRERQKSSSLSTDLQTQIQQVFGRGCYWRSCLAPAQMPLSGGTTSKQSLCAWHGVLKQFLSAEETEQCLLSPSELKSCIAAALESSCSKAEAVKRTIQRSSSLLDELTSRQLATSVGTFFEHVKGSFSNQAFEKQTFPGTESNYFAANRDLKAREEPHQAQSVEDLEAFAEELEQILTLEQSSTKEFQRLIQLTVYPGVDASAIRKACLELKEFDADIRTKDLELIARLSSRKLQLLRRRREDEEARVTLRLAQSHSSSAISAYSAASTASFSSDAITSLTTQDYMGSSSPVYDVVHVLRKGRKSLVQQQQRQRLNQNQGYRLQSASSSSGLSNSNSSGLIDQTSLSRPVSEILYQTHQFELKHPVKRGGSGAPPTKKLPAKAYRR